TAANAAQANRDEAEQARRECATSVGSFDQELAAARTTARLACDAATRVLAETDLPASPAEAAPRPTQLAEWPSYCDDCATAGRRAGQRLETEIDAAARKLEQLGKNSGVELDTTEVAAMLKRFEDATTGAHGAVVAADKDVEAQATRISERGKL